MIVFIKNGIKDKFKNKYKLKLTRYKNLMIYTKHMWSLINRYITTYWKY